MGNKHAKSSEDNPRPSTAPVSKHRQDTESKPANGDLQHTEDTDSEQENGDLQHTQDTDSEQENDDLQHTGDTDNEQENDDLQHTENLIDTLLTVAIDFGTTYSGYVFMAKSEYRKERGKMICPNWQNEHTMTFKTPTSILFRPNKQFHSFGYDAEKYYNENSDTEDFKEWYFFKHFKMKLFSDKNTLSNDTDIEDYRKCGNRMKAVDVFAAAIRFFKEHLLNNVEERNEIQSIIQWVITAPATWDLKAKTLMENAAEKAGIPNEQLILILEPEAASLYCRMMGNDAGTVIAAMQEGSKYIVLDLGGGTTDITVHEVIGQNPIKAIHQACGGYYSGNTVWAEFFKFLTKIFSGPVIHEVKTKHPTRYSDLMETIEWCIVSFTESKSNEQGFVNVCIDCIWLAVYEKYYEEKLHESLKQTPYKEDVFMQFDRMRIRNKLFRSFFDHSNECVIKLLSEIVEKPELKRINTIFAVGGYSESPVLISAIKRKFPHLTVIVPEDPYLAVLKGAVLYGFQPKCSK